MEIVNGWKPLAILAESSILDVWYSLEYAFDVSIFFDSVVVNSWQVLNVEGLTLNLEFKKEKETTLPWKHIFESH